MMNSCVKSREIERNRNNVSSKIKKNLEINAIYTQIEVKYCGIYYLGFSLLIRTMEFINSH